MDFHAETWRWTRSVHQDVPAELDRSPPQPSADGSHWTSAPKGAPDLAERSVNCHEQPEAAQNASVLFGCIGAALPVAPFAEQPNGS